MPLFRQHLFDFAAARRQHVTDLRLLAMHQANPVLAGNPHIMPVLRENARDSEDSVALFEALVQAHHRPHHPFAPGERVGGVNPATGQIFDNGRILSLTGPDADHYVVQHSGHTTQYPAHFLFPMTA